MMMARMMLAMFGILDGEKVVGVAFAITKHHVLTACHNLLVAVGNKETLLQSINVQSVSSLEAPSMGTTPPLRATLVASNKQLDWAVLRVSQEVDLQPVPIWRGDFRDILGEQIILFDLGAGMTTGESTNFMMLFTNISGISGSVLYHSGATFKGDSGGPIVLTSSGPVCGMHVLQINAVPESPAATTENLRNAKSPRGEHDEDLHSSLSGSTAHIGEALRIDVIHDALVRACAPEQLTYEQDH